MQNTFFKDEEEQSSSHSAKNKEDSVLHWLNDASFFNENLRTREKKICRLYTATIFAALIAVSLVLFIGYYISRPENLSYKILRPNFDSKDYKFIKMYNDISLLLISDPEGTSQFSGASLNVAVGSYYDSKTIQGIANLLEHSISKASVNYPNINEFARFVNANEGYFKSNTLYEETYFYFYINHDAFYHALDLFSSFIANSIMNKNIIDREISIINNDYESKTETTEWKIQYILRGITNPAHPFSQNPDGNYNTLKFNPEKESLNIYEEILSFYRRHYSSNLMTLVIYGKDTLIKMETIVKEKFYNILNNKIKKLNTKNLPVPFPSENLGKIINIDTKGENEKNLYILFFLDSIINLYKEKPLNYILYLLNYEGDKSLKQALKKKQLISNLETGVYVRNTDLTIALMKVIIIYINLSFFKVKLTANGFQNVENVYETIFAYIDLLKQKGVSFFKYEELKNLTINQFYFKEETNIIDELDNIAHNMQHYDLEHILCGDDVYFEYNANLIDKFLIKMSSDNSLILIENKDLNNIAVDLTQARYIEDITSFSFKSQQKKSKNSLRFLKKSQKNSINSTNTTNTSTVYDENLKGTFKTNKISVKKKSLENDPDFDVPKSNPYISTNLQLVSICKSNDNNLNVSEEENVNKTITNNENVTKIENLTNTTNTTSNTTEDDEDRIEIPQGQLPIIQNKKENMNNTNQTSEKSPISTKNIIIIRKENYIHENKSNLTNATQEKKEENATIDNSTTSNISNIINETESNNDSISNGSNASDSSNASNISDSSNSSNNTEENATKTSQNSFENAIKTFTNNSINNSEANKTQTHKKKKKSETFTYTPSIFIEKNEKVSSKKKFKKLLPLETILNFKEWTTKRFSDKNETDVQNSTENYTNSTNSFANFLKNLTNSTSNNVTEKKKLFLENKCSKQNISEDEQKDPYLLLNTSRAEIWYKLDRSFKLPKLQGFWSLESPFSFNSSENFIMLTLLTHILEEELVSKFYEAKSAGFEFSVKFQMEGIELVINGFSEKFPYLIENIFNLIKSKFITGSNFETAKSELFASLEKSNKMPLYKEGLNNIFSILKKTFYEVPKLGVVLEKITYEDMINYKEKFFKKMKIKGLVMGNALNSTIYYLSQKLIDLLNYEPCAASELYSDNLVNVTRSSYVYRKINTGKDPTNNLLINYYQFGKRDQKIFSKLYFLSQTLQIISTLSDSIKKIPEGFFLKSEVVSESGIDGLLVIIQGYNRMPNQQDEFLEQMLLKIEELFTNYTIADFNKIKKKVLDTIVVKDKNLKERGDRLWKEIKGKSFNFLFKKDIKNQLSNLDKYQFIEFYRKFFKHICGKISLQIFGNLKNGTQISKETLPDFRTYIGLDTKLIKTESEFKLMKRFN